jgi:glutathione synthase/RimK-type ligase-like ATP-grasp enzyme
VKRVAALLVLDRNRPVPPITSLPMGRAAVALLDEGIEVILADRASSGRVSGFVATPTAWRPIEDVEICGVYDRFPMPRFPKRHSQLVRALQGIPLGNPVSIRNLSADKLASQRHLEARGVVMPEVMEVNSDVQSVQKDWGVAFAKPQFGAVGAGVERVVHGDDVASTRPGALGVHEPTLLQRAVLPPDGWAGIATRTVVQRDADGNWVAGPPVARRSRHDAVVNVSRGATADPAEDVLPSQTVRALQDAAIRCAQALADHPDGVDLLELGVDAMIDPDLNPWVIEVNTRPWGRLSALYAHDPERWRQAHTDLCARPFRYLAGRRTHIR